MKYFFLFTVQIQTMHYEPSNNDKQILEDIYKDTELIGYVT